MNQLLFIISIWATASLPTCLQAQIITVTPGTDMTIKAGTVFSADSLILTPSADFTLSNLSLVKNTLVNHPIPYPYIARVYQFTNSTNPYSGSIRINYRDGEELKGIDENTFTLHINNLTAWNQYEWNSYAATSRDTDNNYVLTAGVDSIALSELTLADDLPAPIIQCSDNLIVTAKTGYCGAVVKYAPPALVVTNVRGIATVTQIAGLASGSIFPIGTTINTFVATNSSGKTDTCSFTVTVLDKEPPHISYVYATPPILWPPNHNMKNVTLHYNAWDNCGPVTSKLTVSSNEPVSGTGPWDKTPDWVIVDNRHVQLRAERSGLGQGRIYTITIVSRDASGNTAMKTTKVVVPYIRGYFSKTPGEESGGYIDANGEYFDQLFDCRIEPNPSSQYFNLTIQSVSSEKIEVNVFDASGKLILKQNTIKDKTIRFGDNLRPGLYMVAIKQGNQYKTVKVIKQ